MRYRIRFTAEAQREGNRLPGHVRQRILRLVEGQAADPYPTEAVELRDCPGFHRIRVDRRRLVYFVDEDAGIVWIIRTGLKHGPEFYQDLPSPG
ncbi:MAG: hypothetical protein HY321_14510 [Armatimonadetes bacterium]|nr:hypothetical protein [Armatimonadota bacterium]